MYTQAFKDRVLAAYPESSSIKEHLENGSWNLARELRLGSSIVITHRDIMAAENLEQLQQLSSDLEERRRIYDELLCGHGTVDCQVQAHQILTHTGQTRVV